MQSRPTPHFSSQWRVVVAAMATLGSISAHAIEASECKALEDDLKRLACYDTVNGRTMPKPDLNIPESVRKELPPSVRAETEQPDTARPGTRPSSLAERWDLDGRPSPALFALRPYKPIYILPAFYSSSPTTHPTSPNQANDATLSGPIDHLEGKFQISLKAKLLDSIGFAGSDLWFGYTQTSRWQIYNYETSRPFRETNYEPEIMYSAPTHYSVFGLEGKLVGLSLTHQSNGRDLPQSRSWNRVIGQVGLENNDWTFLVRPWLRVREKADKDDNSDILDYMGRGELIGIRKLGSQQIAVTLRHSLKGGGRSHGSVAVDWAFPVYGYLKGHVQLFTGYGESLIDYNHRQNSIGVGLSLGEWL